MKGFAFHNKGTGVVDNTKCPFCKNLGKNEFSTKIEICNFLASTVPLISCKKSEKTNESILTL